MLNSDGLNLSGEVVFSSPADDYMTASYASDGTAYSFQYAPDIFARMTEHGYVRKVYTKLYELMDDSRENADD
jgi:hypothetical protein